MKKELAIGLVGGGLYIMLNRFTATPDVILGTFLSMGLCFCVIGLLPVNAYHALKNWKRKTFRSA